MSRYLLIDCGGTKTTFHIYLTTIENGESNLIALHQQTLLNSDFHSFYELLQHFSDSIPAESKDYEAILIAAAGRVENDSVKLTNLDWEISKTELPQYSLKTKIHLVNDLEATAYSPLYPQSTENIIRIGGTADHYENGNYTVLSVGTGFGTAFAAYEPTNKEYVICSGEGGHAAFAPITKTQHDLYEYYMNLYPGKEISVEWFLSGEGLSRIYTYLSGGAIKSPEQISEEARQDCRLCLKTISMFFEILAGVARQAALFPVPEKGLYLTGGVVIHLLPFLNHKTFTRNFARSEKMNALLKKIPVYIIDSHQAPIHGLLYYLKKMI